ncbi:unnamed protein product [Prorocentrum cordatum]|uniref:Cyclic nucleotide-binding domain-containing protein n=1 Tax=Prorocentrum cordatum TaxID=2364126 RepID=A0ABN9WBZ7_9DINO|nr:unnamed protein product [Polarella glacialis]
MTERPAAPSAEAFEAHLRALARALDVQVGLVRSALDLCPDSTRAELLEGAISKVEVAIGDLQSDPPVDATDAGAEKPPATTVVNPMLGKAGEMSQCSHHITDGSFWQRISMNSGVPECLASERGSADEVTVSATVDTTYLTRRKGSVVSEKQASSACIGGMLNPAWSPRQAWDLGVMLLILCDSVVLPFQLAEFHTEPGFDDFWRWFTVGVFLCDVVLNFFTGYLAGKDDPNRQEGTLVTDRASVAIRYLRGWFWIDMLSTVPWAEVVDLFQQTRETDTSSAGQLAKLTKIIKLTRLLRLLRMLRLAKVSVIWDRLEAQVGSITVLNVVSMLKVLGIWTAICHWGACVWWMVGKRDSLVMVLTMQGDSTNELHWTELPRVHSVDDDFGQWRWVDRPASEQYVFCFYWILGVMRTMPAEVTPVNLTERVFVLLFMFFAVMAFAVNITRMTQAWFRFGARRDAFKEEMACVRMHLRAMNCGDALRAQTQTYLSHLFNKRKLHAKEMGLLGALPENLRRKLSQAHRVHYLRRIPQLYNWMDSALQQVCDATDVVDYLPGDKLAERDHDAEAAYVLMGGGLQVYAHSRNSQVSTMVKSWSLSSSRSCSRPTIVDEHCLFELGKTVQSRETVVVLECSEVLRVDRKRFHEAVRSLHAKHNRALEKRREAEMRELRLDGADSPRSEGSLSSSAAVCGHMNRQVSPMTFRPRSLAQLHDDNTKLPGGALHHIVAGTATAG